MPLKKIFPKTPSTNTKTHFRTIVKDRVNKQTLADVANLSATIQTTFQTDDSKSVKSQVSTLSKQASKNTTTNLKEFVKNMKLPKHCQSKLNFQQRNQQREKITSRHSQRSIRSNKSSRYGSFCFNKVTKDFDSKSVMSKCSENGDLSESRLETLSMLNQEKQLILGSSETRIQKLTRLEQRMENLIRTKLQNLMHRSQSKNKFNPRPFAGAGGFQNETTSVENNVIERQIKQIMDVITNLKEKDEEKPAQNNTVKINEITKRINVIQKLMASSYTESQILRKLYFAQKSQKCPHMDRKQKLLNQIDKRKQLLHSKSTSLIQRTPSLSKSPVTKYQTSSKYFYSKPAPHTYSSEKFKYKSFVANRQPLPRSSYGRQFLNYGTLPVFNYKPQDCKHSGSVSKVGDKKTNYQQSYRNKANESKPIDYRELDCYKNKFKPGNISFAQMYSIKDNKEPIKKSKSNKNGKKSKQNLISQTPGSSFYKSSVEKAVQTLQGLQNKSSICQYGQSSGSFSKTQGSQMKREYIWHHYGPKKGFGKLNEEFISQEEKRQNMGGSQVISYGRSSIIKNESLNRLKASYKAAFIR